MKPFILLQFLLFSANILAQENSEIRLSMNYFYDRRSMPSFNSQRDARISDALYKRFRGSPGGTRIDHFPSIYQVHGFEIGASAYVLKNPRLYFLAYYFQGESIIPNVDRVQIEPFPNGINYEVHHKFEEEMKWAGTRVGFGYVFTNNERFNLKGDISFENYYVAEYTYVHSECFRPAGSTEDFFCSKPNMWNSDFHSASGSSNYILASIIPIYSIYCYTFTGTYRFSKHGDIGLSIYQRFGNLYNYAPITGMGLRLSVSHRLVSFKRKQVVEKQLIERKQKKSLE